MRIIEYPKLPRLLKQRYICSRCKCKFEVTDKELLKNTQDIKNDLKVTCPFCGLIEYIYSSNNPQAKRILKYKLIKKNQDRLFGPELKEEK